MNFKINENINNREIYIFLVNKIINLDSGFKIKLKSHIERTLLATSGPGDTLKG
jgi:hypothetical protein